MIEDYENNCYYSYVVKSGIEPGILFINETQLFKDDLSNLLAKTYKIDNHRTNCASIVRATQDLLVMMCSENGEFVIFNRKNMETLVTDKIP